MSVAVKGAADQDRKSGGAVRQECTSSVSRVHGEGAWHAGRAL